MALAIMWNNNSAYASSYDFCKKDRPVTHVPRADVTHDGGNSITITDPIYIPVTIDMAERYGLTVPAGIELESTLGMMEIYKDGKILYDSKDISGNIQSECDDFDRVLEKQISKPKPNKE